MTIWVDADACPAVVKDILFRAARRTREPLVLVANHPISVPADSHISFIQVRPGFDEADNEIVTRVHRGDLLISADIPLAAQIIGKGAVCLTPRGDWLDEGNIASRLSMRDFMDSLRASGVDSGGQKSFSQRDRLNFANRLDQWLQSR